MAGDKKVLRRLRNAQAATRLVRLHRRPSWEALVGYVSAIGDKWVLLQVTNESVHLDGFVAVRLRDIRTVQHVTLAEEFHRRALELHREWPPTGGVDVRLDRTRDLVASLGDAYPTLTFHIERDDPDVCFIGRPVSQDHRAVVLQEITPNARWQDEFTGYRFRELTRIDVDGGYENTVLAVAGPPPDL